MIRVQIMVKTTIGNRYDFLRDDSSCRMNFLGRTACFYSLPRSRFIKERCRFLPQTQLELLFLLKCHAFFQRWYYSSYSKIIFKAFALNSACQ